ncbi:MAG: RNA pseudouridine synthase, partial [Opitutales bacterium]|nr:RNA pseudouridine synthase [Opitutales bacterium]
MDHNDSFPKSMVFKPKSAEICVSNWQQYLNKQVTVESVTPDGIAALNKPQGVLAHPNIDQRASSNAIFTCPYSMKNEMYYSSDGPVAYLLNRLDSPVSGLILIGLNKDVAQAVKRAFREKTVIKKYLALLKGHLSNRQGVWRSNIAKIKTNNTVRAAKYGNNIAITEYKLLHEFSWHSTALSFVELRPITGRTHQLRLHCAQNLVPIIGDKIYGNFT